MAAKRILVVDDEQDSVDFVTAVLAEQDVEVLSARDGEAGLKAAKAQQPDLIVLDLQMPKKDGLTVLSELRRDQAIRRIPVIILTGIGEKTGVRFSKSDVGDFMGEEPDAYIEKPISPEVLKSTVRQLLQL